MTRTRERQDLDLLARLLAFGDEYLVRTVADVARFGCSLVGVLPTEADVEAGGSYSSLTYSVGFTGLGEPEVEVRGLDPDRAGALINDLCARLVRDDDYHLEPGRVFDDLLTDGYLAILAEVTAHEANLARRLYGDAVRVLRLTFQDADRRWPWELGDSERPTFWRDQMSGLVVPA